MKGRRVPLFDISLGADEEATGRENIMLRGLLMGLTRPEIEERIGEICEFSELGDFLDLPTKTYSSGMMLRLLSQLPLPSAAKSCSWTNGSQPATKNSWRGLITFARASKRSNILVLASHSAELLRSICNRAVLLTPVGLWPPAQ